MAADRLIFDDQAGTRVNLPWFGFWPPPQRLYLVHQVQATPTGEEVSTILVDPDSQRETTLAQLVLDHGAVLYIQQSCSDIPEPFPDDVNVFRGAVYLPWTPFREGSGDG